MLSCCNL